MADGGVCAVEIFPAEARWVRISVGMTSQRLVFWDAILLWSDRCVIALCVHSTLENIRIMTHRLMQTTVYLCTAQQPSVQGQQRDLWGINGCSRVLTMKIKQSENESRQGKGRDKNLETIRTNRSKATDPSWMARSDKRH